MDQNISTLLGPVLIIVGSGLLAGGMLYFAGIQYFQSTLQAVAALVGGVVLIGVTTVAFMADNGGFFFQAQKIYVSQCYIDGESAHPEARATSDNAAGRYIAGCIAKLGYEWSPAHTKCRDFLVPMNAFCYLPTNPFSRAVTKVQLSFE